MQRRGWLCEMLNGPESQELHCNPAVEKITLSNHLKLVFLLSFQSKISVLILSFILCHGVCRTSMLRFKIWRT
jgi:hypothetical protein